MFLNCIKPEIEKIDHKNQNIFQGNRTTTSQILTIRQIILEVFWKNLKATLLFVDFSKAFDSIYRGKMEHILLAHDLPQETVKAIMILYKNAKARVHSPDRDTEFFDIVTGILQRHTLAPYLFIICQNYVLQTLINLMKENDFTLKKARSNWYPPETITDTDYADDLALLANTPAQAESLLHTLEQVVEWIFSIWTHIKPSTWVLDKKELSPLLVASFWNYRTSSHTSTAVSHLLKVKLKYT